MMTELLTDLLDEIKYCRACSLIEENISLKIYPVRILPKPNAQIMFVGRDPSPRTVSELGRREENSPYKSIFIEDIFRMVAAAGISDDQFYITDICKCHWRTSVGSPWPGTEARSTQLNKGCSDTCMHKWLFREVEILRPKLVVAFGEEVYQLLRPQLTIPNPSPEKLSASKDKSVLDAEYWLVQNGLFTINILGNNYSLAIIRHPGNSRRLPKSTKGDLRYFYHQKATEAVESAIKDCHNI